MWLQTHMPCVPAAESSPSCPALPHSCQLRQCFEGWKELLCCPTGGRCRTLPGASSGFCPEGWAPSPTGLIFSGLD